MSKKFPSPQRVEKQSLKKRKQKVFTRSSVDLSDITKTATPIVDIQARLDEAQLAGYEDGYNAGYEVCQDNEIAERVKSFELNRDEAKQLYSLLAPQFVNQDYILLHQVIIRLREYLDTERGDI